jgi:hypothetical protein
MSIQNVLRRKLNAMFFALGFMVVSNAAYAASQLSTDLAALVTQGQAVNTQLAGINLTTATGCTDLGNASKSLRAFIASTETVKASITSPFSVEAASLTSLNDLSNINVSIANNIKNLSLNLNTLSTSANVIDYTAMLSAMLRLSTDIGTMADRIGEMADRILVMADNIGLMADRILVTQQIQSTNLAAVQNAMLATQQNAVILSDTISTLVYNPSLASLVTQGNASSTSMNLTVLSTLNMSIELARIKSETAAYLTQVNALYVLIMNDSALASQYTNADTLTMAGDLSNINKALAASLNKFADSVKKLAPKTNKTILKDASASMLVLTRDVGIMSGRIMEMVDRIIIMTDNIGEMSTRIVATENLQQSNVSLTQGSLTTATNTTVTVIKTYGL